MNRARTRPPGLTGVGVGGLAALAALAAACTPDVGANPAIPTAMQFDTTTMPPRVPQPTLLIVNPVSHKIDFSLAGTPIPADCAAQTVMPPAQCEFDQWLQTLNGFPSVSSASAPATGALDQATLTLGTNVVVMATNAFSAVTDVAVAFDDGSTSVTVTPTAPLSLGELYWIGVRGYKDDAVRDAAGGEVVGSPTMALLKEKDSLTCGATDPSQIGPSCPAFQVVAQGATTPDEVAAAQQQLVQLEQARQAYVAFGGFDLMMAAGLPREEIAVLWGFPIHTNSVPLLIPDTAAVPTMTAPNQIAIGVQGPVKPETVSAFVVKQQNGPVVVMDLTAAAGGDLNAGFPPVGAAYVQGQTPGTGAIVIQGQTPFPVGHQIGIFMTNDIHSPDDAPLVASPVSILLTLTAPLVDTAGHSTVSVVSDAQATMLEAGRQGLATVLDNPVFAPLTGVSRAKLVYAYAFQVQP